MHESISYENIMCHSAQKKIKVQNLLQMFQYFEPLIKKFVHKMFFVPLRKEREKEASRNDAFD